MENFKEFQGKDLDTAISEACAYFNVAREKLEIEILQDAKSGIFGIVGARKAKVRARRVRLQKTVESILGNKKADVVSATATEPMAKSRSQEQIPLVDSSIEQIAVEAEDEQAREKTTKLAEVREASAPSAEEVSVRHTGEQPAVADELDEAAEGLPSRPVEELDAQRLRTLTEEVVRQLVRPIVGEDVQLQVSVGNGRVQVQLDCDTDSGLLIGREGQTLASLRYLASRLVSRAMDAAVRIQLDAGEYRRRQDAKLREMALAIAAKVRQTGRSYSTRPLSSYHRRIVHVCLQDAQDVQTRSSGDGPLKRVVIMRRRQERE